MATNLKEDKVMMGFSIAFIIIVLIVLYSLARTAGESDRILENISVATENKKEAESKAEPQESQSVPQADKKMVDTVAVPQNMQAVANGIPVYYQIPVVDGTGNVVQRLPIERSVRKSSNSGVASLFARLSFKKKSRADIVKLVASGDLVPAQLVQIKSAIEKGLTESQLVELINNNISAEKMKEIIEIAVLENSMAD